MVVERLRLRDFRTYASAEVRVGRRLTIVHGPNGAGKTNLLEALYFGCTGRSCRTSNEREVVRFDAPATRVEVDLKAGDGAHSLSVGFQPGEPKRLKADGAPVERLLDAPARPLGAVFLPDRLELVKGAPAARRAHLDQVVAGLWPARTATRRAYAQALAQRNALLLRLRAGACRGRDALAASGRELAGCGPGGGAAGPSEPQGGRARLAAPTRRRRRGRARGGRLPRDGCRPWPRCSRGAAVPAADAPREGGCARRRPRPAARVRPPARL